MDMTSVDKIAAHCQDCDRLKAITTKFGNMRSRVLRSDPRTFVQKEAQAAVETAAKLSSFAHRFTFTAAAERMAQYADGYTPGDHDSCDPINDLSIATKLLVENTLIDALVAEIADIKVPETA